MMKAEIGGLGSMGEQVKKYAGESGILYDPLELYIYPGNMFLQKG